MSETQTITLTDFLLARIEEDEAVARYAMTRDAVDDRSPGGWGGWWLGHYQHATRHDPARVLAECASKRRIIALHSEDEEGGGLHVCHDSLVDETECGELRALASVYADHEGFRPEWAL